MKIFLNLKFLKMKNLQGNKNTLKKNYISIGKELKF